MRPSGREYSASPAHAPNERRNPADSHSAGRSNRTKQAEKAIAFRKSYFLPNTFCTPSAAHMITARTEETLNPQNAAYRIAAETAGITRNFFNFLQTNDTAA